MSDTADDDRATGLPVLTTWPAVYGLAVAALVAYVVALAVLSRWSP